MPHGQRRARRSARARRRAGKALCREPYATAGCRRSKREDQVFGVQLELLQAHFFKLFVFAEIGLLKQFFQTLSVAAMFGMQAIDLFAQRGTFTSSIKHPRRAVPVSGTVSRHFLGTFTYIAAAGQSASGKTPKVT